MWKAHAVIVQEMDNIYMIKELLCVNFRRTTVAQLDVSETGCLLQSRSVCSILFCTFV